MSEHDPIQLPTIGAAIVVVPVIDHDRPAVQVSWPMASDGLNTLRLDLNSAEHLALELQRAARAAEMDSFLLCWMLESGFFEPDDAGVLLGHFHKWRLATLTNGHRPPRSIAPNGGSGN